MGSLDIPKVDFIGIGAARSASTWIFECLTEHPQICGTYPKETKFFLERGHDIAEYGKFFATCPRDSVRGEFTPGYMHSAQAAEEIKKYYPDVKFIVCLRNPIEQLVSMTYYNLMREGNDPARVRELAEEKLALYPGKEDTVLARGKYFQSLEPYRKLFPKENLRILFYEDIEKNPAAFIQSLYTFLGVDSSFVPKALKEKVNITATNKRRFPLLNKIYYGGAKMLSGSALGRGIKKVLIALGVKNAIHTLQVKNIRREGLEALEKKPLSKEKREALRKYYENDIRSLEEYTGRTLENWK